MARPPPLIRRPTLPRAQTHLIASRHAHQYISWASRTVRFPVAKVIRRKIRAERLGDFIYVPKGLVRWNFSLTELDSNGGQTQEKNNVPGFPKKCQGSYGFQVGAGERTHPAARCNLRRKRCNLSMRSRHFRQEVIIEFDAFCCRARARREGVRLGHWTFLPQVFQPLGTRRISRRGRMGMRRDDEHLSLT